MAFCTFCGTQVPDDIKFCTSCGKPMGITVKVPVQPVQQVQPQAPSPPPQPQQAPSVYAQPQTAPPPQQAYTVPAIRSPALCGATVCTGSRPERPAPGQQVRTDHDRRIYRHHVADDATHRQLHPAPGMGMRRLPESE